MTIAQKLCEKYCPYEIKAYVVITPWIETTFPIREQKHWQKTFGGALSANEIPDMIMICYSRTMKMNCSVLS